MYDAGTDTPLFGVARPRDRFLSYLLAGFTCLLVLMNLFLLVSLLFVHSPFLVFILLSLLISGFLQKLESRVEDFMQNDHFTFVSSLFPLPPDFNKVFLSIAIIFVCIGELLLIFWYKKGDLDPKFRKLILYNCFTLILLCLSANLFYYPK